MVFQKAEMASNKSCSGSWLQVKSTKPAGTPRPVPNPAFPHTSCDTMTAFIPLKYKKSVTREAILNAEEE